MHNSDTTHHTAQPTVHAAWDAQRWSGLPPTQALHRQQYTAQPTAGLRRASKPSPAHLATPHSPQRTAASAWGAEQVWRVQTKCLECQRSTDHAELGTITAGKPDTKNSHARTARAALFVWSTSKGVALPLELKYCV